MNAFSLLGVVGPWQVIIIIAVILLFFGGKKIPELMKGIGKGVREFKEGLDGKNEKNDPSKKEDPEESNK